jgi:hypothetical protein
MAGRTEEPTAGLYEGKHTHRRSTFELDTSGAETQAVEGVVYKTEAEIATLCSSD